jgi:PIN domain nuclease of toxin-antitoxin system
MILLDTHSWIWWISNPELLSAVARETIDDAARKHELFVSTISSWELALLVEKGRLALSLDVRDWIARSEALPFLSFVPLTNAIAIESVRLQEFPHADPADRIIVATAMSLGARVVTKDENISRYPPARALW